MSHVNSFLALGATEEINYEFFIKRTEVHHLQIEMQYNLEYTKNQSLFRNSVQCHSCVAYKGGSTYRENQIERGTEAKMQYSLEYTKNQLHFRHSMQCHSCVAYKGGNTYLGFIQYVAPRNSLKRNISKNYFITIKSSLIIS